MVDGSKIAILSEQQPDQAEQQDIDAILFINPDLEYTAMLELRTVISKKYGFKSFWE